MADIYHQFVINALPEKVFEAISRSKGLDNWWTRSSSENPEQGGTYTLYFGPQYNWKATVTKYLKDSRFELQLTEADDEWKGTRVGFILRNIKGITEVNFYHTGWPAANEHYRISSYCWAMYLRILKRFIEFGDQVPYDKRLDV
jgi:uncharacterized protein YndB with AHSA1/START domain